MDILEDLTNAIRYILNYLGFDVDNLGQILRPLPTRQNNIRHRSFIRRLGSRLPLKPAKRIHVQTALLSNGRRDIGLTGTNSFCSDLSYVSSGGENLVWVEEDLGNDCIMVRPRGRDKSFEEEPELQDLHDDNISVFSPVRILGNERTSTPFDQSMGSVSAVSSTDPFTQQKISSMEEELAALRSQIALLIKNQEHTKQPPIPFPDMSTGCGVMAPPPPPACPPPPPPPPPPSTPNLGFKAPKPGKTLAELLKENKDNLHAGDASDSNKPSGPPSMSDVLKGLGTVKLRSVQRSPGGTPLKPDKPKLSDSQDAASLIAMALKKKFASRMLHSPRSPISPDFDDKENAYNSPDSPIAPFGQQLLKKTQKRSVLFQERRKSASPLQERNQ